MNVWARRILPIAAVVVSAAAAGADGVQVTRWNALQGNASLDGGVLTMRGCCTAWGRAVVNLPGGERWFGVTIDHANTDCLRVSQARVATRSLDGGISGGARFVVVLNQPDGSVTFRVPQEEGERLALVLETEGGLRCCGETLVRAVTITPW